MGLLPTVIPALSWGVLQLQALGQLPTEVKTVFGITMIIVLIGFSAFFSSSEIAMFGLESHRVESLVEEGVPSADLVQDLLDDPHRLLVTILVGNNIANVAMSSIATWLFGFYMSEGQAVLAATFGITTVVLLFGESAPKSYAVENTESWSLRIARPLKWAERLLLPLIFVFDYLTQVINRITGGGTAVEDTYVSRDEIQNMIRTGEREGVIDEEEREMLQRIFRFNQTIAKEVMTPRLDMTAVPKDATVEEAIEECVQADHERVPVYEGNLDNIIGVVNIRDLVRAAHYGEGEPELEDVVRPTLHVPESKNVDELLQEIQDNRLQMVIVIDEFGTTEGLITLEDMVEEIVGDILEGDEEEAIEFVDDDTALIRGEVNIDEVNEALDVNLPEGEEFETLAGFIFNRAGRLVEEGETIAYDGIRIRVEEVDTTRIKRARVTVTEEYYTDDDDEVDEEVGETDVDAADAE
jgi:putative hemolysin